MIMITKALKLFQSHLFLGHQCFLALLILAKRYRHSH